MRTISMALFFSLVATSGCDDKHATTGTAQAAPPATATAKAKVASCDTIKVESLCREYGPDNIDAAGLDFLKGACTGGDFKVAPCPKEGRLGACTTPEGTKVAYSTGGYPSTVEKAAKSCSEGLPVGVWKAGN